jgi:hypothetical protein
MRAYLDLENMEPLYSPQNAVCALPACCRVIDWRASYTECESPTGKYCSTPKHSSSGASFGWSAALQTLKQAGSASTVDAPEGAREPPRFRAETPLCAQKAAGRVFGATTVPCAVRVTRRRSIAVRASRTKSKGRDVSDRSFRRALARRAFGRARLQTMKTGDSVADRDAADHADEHRVVDSARVGAHTRITRSPRACCSDPTRRSARLCRARAKTATDPETALSMLVRQPLLTSPRERGHSLQSDLRAACCAHSQQSLRATPHRAACPAFRLGGRAGDGHRIAG